MKYLIYFLPVVIGIALTTQSGVNSQLKTSVNNPWMAAFISFLVGTIALAAVIVITKQTVPSMGALKSIELYKYTGGILGAFIVTGIIFSVQKVGSANMFAMIIAGQLLTALLFDHLGLFGFRQANINWVKITGVVLLISGAYLINKK